jgi:hypothetical protein
MKPVFIKLLLAIVIVSVVSCSSDDGPSVDPELFDTWTLSTTVFRDCTDPSLDDIINEVCNDNSCQKMVLNSDYTYQMIVTTHGVDEISSGTFEVIANEIQLVTSSGTAEIVEFSVTPNSLVFSTDILACTQNLVYTK